MEGLPSGLFVRNADGAMMMLERVQKDKKQQKQKQKTKTENKNRANQGGRKGDIYNIKRGDGESSGIGDTRTASRREQLRTEEREERQSRPRAQSVFPLCG